MAFPTQKLTNYPKNVSKKVNGNVSSPDFIRLCSNFIAQFFKSPS